MKPPLKQFEVEKSTTAFLLGGSSALALVGYSLSNLLKLDTQGQIIAILSCAAILPLFWGLFALWLRFLGRRRRRAKTPTEKYTRGSTNSYRRE